MCSFMNHWDSIACEVCDHPQGSVPPKHMHQHGSGNKKQAAKEDIFADLDVQMKAAPINDLSGKMGALSVAVPQVDDSNNIQAVMKVAAVSTPARKMRDDMWACSWCQYLNPLTAQSCEVCEKDGTASRNAQLVKLQISRQQQVRKQAGLEPGYSPALPGHVASKISKETDPSLMSWAW
jgi:hypothetical protein